MIDVAEEKDMDLILNSVQKSIQEQFNLMDSSLAKGAEEIRSVLQDPSGIRKILKDLYSNNPQVVNVSFIDIEGVLKYIYPDEFDYVEGDWIGDRVLLLLRVSLLLILNGQYLRRRVNYPVL